MTTNKRLLLATACLALTFAWATPVEAQLSNPTIGEAAPAFTLQDTYGNERTLEAYRGEWVVLEWLNYGCPYVRKHYDSGNMPALQAKYRDAGVVWFSIVSSAPGKQGYYEPTEMNAMNDTHGNSASAVLLDPSGTVGRAYGARTTPQMVVIDPEGVLRYNGAIDDKPTTRVSDIEGAHSYLVAALDQAMAGEEVRQPRTQPYGCSVKYDR
ncbi:MAG: thioredoxin family protein [Gemmatimonadales bacterium]|jgi:cytochrome oxidase Cu insertion factor (SCO1/SenC/PrrC family)